jgi:hypothetical protein
MSERVFSREPMPRSRLLAANIALALACTLPASAGSISPTHAAVNRTDASSLSTKPAQVASVVVTNCNDSGSGSLREAFANAVDGTLIDLSQLQCGAITLTTGEIGDTFGATNVTISGAGQTIAIDGTKTAGRVIHHYGNGNLALNKVTIANGQPTATNPYGGCILSRGHVSLYASTVTQCNVVSENGTPAYGGSIFAYGIVTLNRSVVSYSTAKSVRGHASGGGIWSHGTVLIESTVSFNKAIGNKYHDSQGGGVFTSRVIVTPSTEVTANYSTITLNTADQGGGIACDNIAINRSTVTFNTASSSGGGVLTGINATNVSAQNQSSVYSSTLSENYSSYFGGGIAVQAPGHLLSIFNSTVLHNFAYNGGGVYMGGQSASSVLAIESDILAGNVLIAGAGRGGASGADIGGKNAALTGDHNIILDSTIGFPSDTIKQPPLVSSLNYNGGYTETLALLPGSPAIDGGINNLKFSFDQRGPGFPRQNGKAPDIGAFECNDVIFTDGFNPK